MFTSLIFIIQLTPLVIVTSFICQQTHLLITLLSLEGLTLSLVLTIPITLSLRFPSLAISGLIILALGVCEARLGLALLVILTRS